MTTPRPTVDRVSLPTVPTGMPANGDRPDWLPDEATLNRLAGEFFAALPGAGSAGLGQPEVGAPVRAAPGEVDQAPRVDVPARASDVPQVPGDSAGYGTTSVQSGLGQSAGQQPSSPQPLGTPGPPRYDAGAVDPAAASGLAPSRAVPDLTEGPAAGFAGLGGLNSPLPESPLTPGFAGLQVAPAGELTPPPFGLAAPLPSAGVPGVPASDQAVAGLPTSSVPDMTAAQPFSIVDGISAPGVPPVPAPSGVTGATGLPSNPTRSGSAPALPADRLVGDPTGDIANPGFAVPSIPQPPLPVPDPPAPVPSPSTPYYFLAETSSYRVADDSGLESLVDVALRSVEVEPPRLEPVSGATGGRGDPADLSSGLANPASTGAANPASTGAAPGVGELASPAFYFVDRPVATGTQPVGPRNGITRQGSFDINRVRRDFPILAERVNGKPLVWLDNAATTQKPQAVLDRLAHFYAHENSNIHRAAHELAARATDAYEGARKTVARFIGAQTEKNIVFVRGATEAINLVAKSWGKANIRRGDEIILSHLEHHANIVPWQMLVAETGAKLRIIPVDDTGQLIMSEYGRLLSEKTKLVAVTQVSNALGTVTPAQQVVEMGHRAGACVLIDGAQSVPHLRVNMQTLGADFFVFSGHKIFGPTGIGVLYGRQEVLDSMPPWEGGGNMIVDVTFEKTSYQKPPGRFEAGTGNIADAVGLGAALDYVSRLGLETIAHYEHALLEYATPRMCAVSGLRMIGTASEKASVLSFVLDGYRTEEVGSALNQEGIAVRSGHHCAQPILRRFGLETTVRPSVAFYNTFDEIDLLVSVLHRLAAARGNR